MTAASTPTQGCKREPGSDDAAPMPPTQILKRGENDAPPGVDLRKFLELHVQDTNGMWWPMPLDLSDRLLEGWCSGENLKVVYVGDYVIDYLEESRACYVIDFATMRQRNTRTNCELSIKIVEVVTKGQATE